MTRGIFITFEGGDGVGKTTQIRLLRSALESSGFHVTQAREPGGTPLGDEIRELVLHSRGHIAPRSEALLYAADRAQNVEAVVRPALERGEVVLQDRYFDSSVAYQGSGRVLGAEDIKRISLWAAGDLVPHLTVLLDLDEASASERLLAQKKPYDRFESEKAEFHARVRQAFLDIATAEPQRFLVIDARLSETDIADRILSRVSPLLDNLEK
ncbi:MAG: dTMP kinase [Microbacteriaceae bacterium]|nr:dTMP kinase [Microbacteriaceae bacterium]